MAPLKGSHITEEHKQKIAAALRGRKHPRSRRMAISRGMRRHYDQKNAPAGEAGAETTVSDVVDNYTQ